MQGIALQPIELIPVICSAVPEDATFDIQFDDEANSNNKGFALSIDAALNYLRAADRSQSYWPDYIGGTVSIVCNETGEVYFYANI
jgi:hypothetical protein